MLAGGRSLQLPPTKAHSTLQLPASNPGNPADSTYLVLWGIGAVNASSSGQSERRGVREATLAHCVQGNLEEGTKSEGEWNGKLPG